MDLSLIEATPYIHGASILTARTRYPHCEERTNIARSGIVASYFLSQRLHSTHCHS
jgi:hypothetical protein